jgi:proton-translocating NADH-quinone oxidoreductase chain N
LETLIGLPLAALGIGIILMIALGGILKPRAKGWLAFISGLAALFSTLYLVPWVARGAPLETTLLPWDLGIAWQARVDGLSLVFSLMATGIGTAILFYCIDYMGHEPSGTTRFYVLMLTFIAGLVGLVYSANLLLAYVCWELIGLCSYFLVGFWYQNPAAANGARKVLIMTHIPGYAFLLGILILYISTGTLLWTDPVITTGFTTGVFLLMLIAAMAKSVMFPLHTWIPEAMNAPTPVSALLHSACYVKAGIYLVARMYSLYHAPWPVAWQTVVLAVGCVTMLVGALFALAQKDLKRLLAFSTISQLGYLVTGIGLGTSAGLTAALFYTISHGLFKGTLFLCAGSVQHATGTRDMRELGGLAPRMPRTALAWVIAGSAIIGVPLTNGFVSKWMLFDATLNQGQWIAVAIAWLVSVVTAFYILKATVSVFFSEPSRALQSTNVHESPLYMQAGMLTLAGFCVLFGIAPQILNRWVVTPAVQGLGFTSATALTWFGFHTPAGSMSAVIGMAIILVAVLIGWLFVSLNNGRQTSPAQVFTGGELLPEGNTVGADDFAAIAEAALQPVYHSTDPDPVYVRIWNGIRNSARWSDEVVKPLEVHPLIASLVLAVFLAVVVWFWQ